MDARQDILDQIPMDQLAAQVGADEQTTRAAAEQLIPALVGGLQANAQDPAGAQSLFDALGDHQGGAPSLDQVDTQEGQQIVSHVFGANQDEVVNRLGGMDGGAGGDILKKLLPILAPIVLSYISGKVLGGQSGGQSGGQTGGQAAPQQPADQAPTSDSSGAGQAPAQDSDAGGLGDILGSILGGMGGSQGGQSGGTGGGTGLPGGLGDILGGILGGGRR